MHKLARTATAARKRSTVAKKSTDPINSCTKSKKKKSPIRRMVSDWWANNQSVMVANFNALPLIEKDDNDKAGGLHQTRT